MVKRINRLRQEQTRFIQLTGQTLPVTIHADFVLPQFADKRGVEPSLGIAEYLQTFRAQWDQSAEFQVHLMGEDEDMQEARDFFAGYPFHSEWSYQILVRERDASDWLELEQNNENVKIGLWYDLDQWPTSQDLEDELYLLMTVQAGKSGQLLTEEVKQKALEMVQNCPEAEFIVDGGWPVEIESSLHNLSVVSFSSFWKKF